MIRYSLVLLSFILFSCNSGNNQVVKDNPLVLDFPYPDWHESGLQVIYSECGNISERIEIDIYGDSTIDLNTIDSRLSIKLKFNWLLDNERLDEINISTIDIIKENNVISSMNFSYVKLEAFMNNDPQSKRFEQPVKTVYLKDVNLDSFLDLTIRWNSHGKESYWLYSPNKEIFEFYEELNYMEPYHIDCKSNIIYSYEWGDMYDMVYKAYKVEGISISPYQRKKTSFNKKYNIVEYSDTSGAIISRDTIYKD